MRGIGVGLLGLARSNDRHDEINRAIWVDSGPMTVRIAHRRDAIRKYTVIKGVTTVVGQEATVNSYLVRSREFIASIIFDYSVLAPHQREQQQAERVAFHGYLTSRYS